MDSDRQYLLSLQAVRSQAAKVLEAARRGSLKHFDFHESRMKDVAEYVLKVIERDFGPDRYHTIPPHGRWQHFEVGQVSRIDTLVKRWSSENDVEAAEITRRLVDLFFVSVLLDAGAGDDWRYQESETGQVFSRSEGIAVASLHMFTAGAFSSNPKCPDRADGAGLVQLQDDDLAKYFQLSAQNPMVGASSRVKLLQAVGSSLIQHPEIFGEQGRPGNLVEYLSKSASASNELDFEQLWSCLQELLIPAWPQNRTLFNGKPIGDAWPLQVLEDIAGGEGDDQAKSRIQPFHKLTQWLAYSLSVPFERQLGYTWKNMHLGTGLPEYRNGGLFVDLRVLVLKPEDLDAGRAASGTDLAQFEAGSDVVVEWRAMTVALLDELHKMVADRMSSKGITLSLPQMLEAGSWKSGRELAATSRPGTKSSPILVISDGTLY